MFGSQIPFFAISVVMPEIGVAAKVSQVLNSGLGKVGLNRAAGLFAPRVKALVGGEERTLAGGAGREAIGDFTSWAPTGVIDAASNTENVAQYLREQGYSDDEIYERMKKEFGYELPYDIVSQGLFGTFVGGRGVRAALSGKIDGYDLGGSGDVPVQVRSLADDAAPFIGVTMDNGTEGCVEAVTKIGANSSAFLAQELKNGVVNVDRLVEDAGDNVIAFDPNQLEEGDVIVYGDESDPQRHVVLYDGKGGYIGNSSSHNQVVQGSDYNQMGDWHPTKIIKSGALFRGTSVRPISAPQMDFTGLVFDEKDIAATQKALNNLVHGGQPTPEQSAAILSAAEAIRDMPLGSVDKTAEAESYNEWQKLIDTKDIAGIVDKDPEGVARMVHQLAGAQKQQQTRAAIENQQQIEATKQAIAAIQQQRIEAAQARINNAVAQRNATVQDPQMQAEAPMQGAVQTPQIPMQAAPTNNIVGDTVVENVAPQTFSSPVEEAAKSLPVSHEELSGILGKVQQWEQPLLSIPAYVQARDRQDWATAAQIAANAGQPGVAQFYNTLMEHGSRNAQNVTPVPQENAPTVTPYAPQENVVAAPPVQNASAPIPVVGVRPLVPERLPDSTTGRRDLAHALGRFMVANNIPISKGLRDDLSIGYGKAIRYADEKIRKWENERAGNAPQTAQGGAQSTETQADDRMLAQRGERAQNGSKAVRGKSAQKQAENEFPPGYRTESGRPVSKADPKEFIIKPNGSRNFGEIPQEIEDATGGKVKSAPIRLRVGTEDGGFVHLVKEHAAQMKQKGYGVMDYINHILQNFNQVYSQQTEKRPHRFVLYCKGDESKGFMPIDLELEQTGENCYIIVSAMPHRPKINGTLLFDGSANPSAATTDDTLLEEINKNGGVDTSPNTHGKSKVPSASTISPEESESKENPLHEDEQTALKGLSADAKDVYRLVRDKLAGSSNKKVARAASVGAVLLARHADIIARKIRTALGKPFTAMDYYRNMFALKTEGDKTGANVLHQAANAGGKMYAQSTTNVPSAEKDAVRKQYKGTAQWMKAPNGEPTNLTEDQWVAVRTPAFKAWFGDWEKASAAREIHALIPVEVALSGKSLDKKTAEEVFSSFGEVENVRYGAYATFPKSMVGKIIKHKGLDVSQIIADIPHLFSSSVLAFVEPEYKREGHKEHPNILAYHHYVNKFKANGKTYYIRFSLREEKTKDKQKRNGKRILHSTGISDIEIYEDNKKDVSSQRIRVSDPGEESKTSFIDYRLADFFDSVKDCSKVVDENGEPLVVYHQTRNMFDSFDVRHEGAGRNDSETPYGVFLKPNAEDIGVGDIQMPLFARVCNPLRFKNREQLAYWAKKEIKGYAELADRLQALDADYEKRSATAEQQENELYEEMWKAQERSELSDEEYEAKAAELEENGAWGRVLKEWQETAGAVRHEMKELLDAAVRFSGHDGFLLDTDAGAFGRKVSAIVALTPQQVKSATDNNGAFSPDDANIFNQSAWHGSPHDFVEFLLSAIGTGEGTQVHGWGLYFAQNREVSQRYRERLKQPGLFYDGKEKKELPSDIQEALDSVFKGMELFIHDKAEARKRFEQALVKMQKNVDKARDSLAQNEEHVRLAKQNPNMSVPELLKKMGVIESVEEVPSEEISSEELSYDNMLKELEAMKTSSEKELREYQRAYGLLQKIDPEKIETSKPGKLYEVEIPDNDVLLDEQKSLADQHENVRELLATIVKEDGGRLLEYLGYEKHNKEYAEIIQKIGRLENLIKLGKRVGNGAFITKFLSTAGYEGKELGTFWNDRAKAITEKERLMKEYSKSKEELEKKLSGFAEEFLKEKNILKNITGEDFYIAVARAQGSQEKASRYLNSHGIKGITYDGRRDGRCFVIFDDKAISIIEKFNQQMNEIIKGTTQDIPNGQRIISLFEAADESTFLHEMGHLFLLDLEHLAPMSPTAEKDLATVKKWAEWREGQAAEYKGTPFAAEFAYIDARIRAAIKRGDEKKAEKLKRQWEHERFARGFEMYLKTGDAPTKGLRAVFAKFRAFLQRVYQAFTGTGGKATPEVEEVMARMISIEDSSDLSAYPRGKETEVYTDSGKSIPVQYRVVSADDLIASHDASALEINPGYPSALQPRDRERVVMRQQVERMSNTLRPEELGEGRNLNQGAPLIRSDGVVLNGNGRTIAIARAQARNRERAAAYRDYLMENAGTFGLSREAVERVDNPVLVREVQGDISADTMNDIIGSTPGWDTTA